MATTDSLLIRVTLNEVEPTVWRTLVVPQSQDLLSLAVASFLSMGWDADHPFYFVLPNKGKVLDPKSWNNLTEGEQILMAPANAENQDLRAFFNAGDLTLVYETEIPWKLSLTLDSVGVECDDTDPIRVAFGAYAGPPQWSGGKEGYRFLCETLSNPESPDYTEVAEMMYEPFSPTFFSVGFANDRIGINQRQIEDDYCAIDED